MQHSSSRKKIKLKSKGSSKMPCREEHTERLPGQSGGWGWGGRDCHQGGRAGTGARAHSSPSQERGSWGAPGQPPPGHRTPPSPGTGWTQAHGGSRLSRSHLQAGKRCGELETSPASVSVGQGLAALGGWVMESWAMDGVGELREGSGQSGLTEPMRTGFTELSRERETPTNSTTLTFKKTKSVTDRY